MKDETQHPNTRTPEHPHMDYTFTAIDARGAQIQDRLIARSEDSAIRSLHQRGYVILALKPVAVAPAERATTTGRLFLRRSRRIRGDQVVTLTRELAIMIETGVPLVEALETTQEHAESLPLREALSAVLADLSEGRTLSQAMRANPRLFPRLYVDMVQTAEAGGSLSAILNQAADYLEAAQEMRRKVVGAFIYPAVLLCAAAGVMAFLLLYLLPQFKELFIRMNVPLPLSTRILLATSDALRACWWGLPPMILGGIWGLRVLLQHPSGRHALVRFSLRLPVIGDTVRKVALARILRALGTLLATGLSILIALETAAQTGQNIVYEQAMLRAREGVEEGQSLTEALRSAGVFPATVCQMVAAGEKSGQLSAVLMRVALYYERETDARLKMLTSVIEPLMIVLLGCLIGLIAISVIGPIYSLVGGVN